MATDERVEAAAKAISPVNWDNAAEWEKNLARGKAQVALAAADAVEPGTIAELRAEVERLKADLDKRCVAHTKMSAAIVALEQDITQLREDRRLKVELIRELEEMASDFANHHGHSWDGTGYYGTLCKRVKEATYEEVQKKIGKLRGHE